jgi:hypothetical protein
MPVYAVGKQPKGQSATKIKICAHVVQLDKLFFVAPSDQSNFQGKLLFQARQKAKIDHF